jgi:hypothetical protein
MQRERRVQVVLGEAERADGLIRFVLEAEGFDLIGMASNEEELSRVLRGAKPSVLVLDGGISAAAALAARQRVAGAALVVVWPDGVSAVLAEERVEPHMVIEDLGDAVRRAAARVERADTIVVPEAEIPVPAPAAAHPQDAPADETEPRPSMSKPWRRRGRVAQVLVAAATWLLVITAFTAIAAAVPHVVDTFRGKQQNAPRPTAVSPSERPTGPAGSTDPTPGGPARSARRDRCGDEAKAVDRAGDGSGDPVRAQGCPNARETSPNGSRAGRKAEDPGSEGAGDGSPAVPPEEPGSLGEDAPPPDDDPGSLGEDVPPPDPGEDDEGDQTEGNGAPGGPPDQAEGQAPQIEGSSVGQSGTGEAVDQAVDGAALDDQLG